MKTTVKQQVTVEKEVDIGVECDECGKEIRNKETMKKRFGSYPYYEVTTHHSDWGNDSVDSYEYYDLCSLDCLMTHMKRYYDKASGSEEYEVERTW